MRLAMSNDTTGARGRVRTSCSDAATWPLCISWHALCQLTCSLRLQEGCSLKFKSHVGAALPASMAAHHKTCLAARELQPGLDSCSKPWGCVQLQEASQQLARTQHSYDELQRKQESLISEMEDAIARRTAIQIKVCAPHVGSVVTC